MKKVKLSQGRYALVDDDDFNYLSQFVWHYHKKPKDLSGYAVSSTPPLRNKKMHRVILRAKRNEITDHINLNGIDNRKQNLRLVSKSVSAFNKYAFNKHGARGVKLINDKYWVARITPPDGGRVYLGTFKTKIQAAKAYDRAVNKYHNGIGIKNGL